MSNINLSNEDRLLLDKMLKANDAEDNTEKIKTLKHSIPIERDVRTYIEMRRKFNTIRDKSQIQIDSFNRSCERNCSFLFKNYTALFNKLVKDELNLEILQKFIMILREIEQGKVNQHEGSIKVGTILKELYIDSALKNEHNSSNKSQHNNKSKKYYGKSIRQRNRANAIHQKSKKTVSVKTDTSNKQLSWSDYKKTMIES